jgi:predicted Zn finger-like uncharacterized protein
MSLITQCPACSTMFKVVPDQLRISDGWVRCGQCDEVFDANAHLLGAATPDTEAQPEFAAHEVAEELPDSVVPERFDFLSIEPEPTAEPDVAVAEIPPDPFLEQSASELSRILEFPVDSSPDLEPEPEPEPEPELQNQFLDDSVVADVPGDLVDEYGGVEPAADASPFRFVQADAIESPTESDPNLSFMRPARKASVWSRPLIRASLVLLCVLLAGVLLLQITVQERDRIAAMEPAAKPFVSLVCEALVCKIAPLQQIESVVIDSSSFTKVRADVYRLNFTLKNSAPIEVAMPAMELALTDMQDRPLVRRIFAARELGIEQAAMAPGVELAASLAINVRLPAPTDRVSGYRLLAFYP